MSHRTADQDRGLYRWPSEDRMLFHSSSASTVSETPTQPGLLRVNACRGCTLARVHRRLRPRRAVRSGAECGGDGVWIRSRILFIHPPNTPLPFFDHTFTTWSELNRRIIRTCYMSLDSASGHTSGSENVQHRSPAEISKGSFASFTVELQN